MQQSPQGIVEEKKEQRCQDFNSKLSSENRGNAGCTVKAQTTEKTVSNQDPIKNVDTVTIGDSEPSPDTVSVK